MARKDYQERLDDLRQDVLYMGEVVINRLEKGLDALETKDDDLAWEVIEKDSEVNDLYLEIEQECIDLLALQQPVAGDLRFIVASFKIITDLERVGDLATNLGDYALDAEKYVFPEVDIRNVGDDASEMVSQAMEAYENEDTDLTYEISEYDDGLDQRCEEISNEIIRNLIEMETGDADEDIETTLNEVSRLLLTVRDLERVGDHAVNIAARTLYMVENDDELIW
ncbi:MAG: phosphate signaling complex protein PhoU [Halobacteria archaeon]|nr:phosphate signaling complex protein PhoU [Halobacteria archaeon]